MTYFEVNKLQDLNGDAFLMLINVYTDDLLPQMSQAKKFITNFCQALQHIEDESTLHSLISILVCLGMYFYDYDLKPNPIMTQITLKQNFYRDK